MSDTANGLFRGKEKIVSKSIRFLLNLFGGIKILREVLHF